MIEEIKRRLEAGEVVELECVDRIGFLKDIDRSETNEKILDQGPLVVDYIDYDGDIRLGGNIGDIYLNVIVSEEFKYFRIKRTSNYDPIEGEGTLPSLNLQGKGTPIYSEINFQNSDPDLSDKPTFDDLIDILIKAKKDNIVSRVEINRNSLNATVNLTDSKITEFCISKYVGSIVFKEYINWINSLYTETFVIEGVEDMRKMRIESKGVLPNGLEFKVTDTAVKMFDGENDLAITVNFNGMDHNELLYLSPLKGATVTQKRGK